MFGDNDNFLTLVVTNPIDVVIYQCQEITKYPKLMLSY